MVSSGHLGILRGRTRGTLAASGQGSCMEIYVHQPKRALQCLARPLITPCEINPPLTGSAIALFAAGLWNKGKVQNDGVAPEVFEPSCSSPGRNIRTDSACGGRPTIPGQWWSLCVGISTIWTDVLPVLTYHLAKSACSACEYGSRRSWISRFVGLEICFVPLKPVKGQYMQEIEGCDHVPLFFQ